MRVQSPVGEFPVKLVGLGIEKGEPRLEMAMGAWRSKVVLDRSDLPLLGAVLALFALVFAAGRQSSR